MPFDPARPAFAHLQDSSKRKRLSRLIPLVVAANWCALSRADDGKPEQTVPSSDQAATNLSHLHWMDQRGVDYILKSIPAPPAPGSIQATKDLQALLAAQRARTPAETSQAGEDEPSGLEALAQIIGPDFTLKNYPVTYALLSAIGQDENYLISQLQKRYDWKPPYAVHPEIKSLYKLDRPTYPDAALSSSRILVFILAELFRPKTAELVQRDLALGQDRVIAGVNYPTDIIAARQFAQSFLFVVHDTPAFQHALNRAKAEIVAKSVPTK